MDEEILRLIRKYYDDWFEINRIYQVWAKEHDIPQKALFVLLEIVMGNDQCTQHMICKRTSYQKQTVSKILNSFEEQGIINRVINEKDKRNRIIVLTPDGKEYATKLLHEMREIEVDAFLHLSPKERKTIIQGFHLLVGALDESFSKAKRRKEQLILDNDIEMQKSLGTVSEE